MTTNDPDLQFIAGTVEHGARDTELFDASGKKSGHGTIAWLPAPSYDMKARSGRRSAASDRAAGQRRAAA